MDSLDVMNTALVRMGAKPVTSVNESSDRAATLRTEIDKSRLETLRAHPWNFARKRTQIDAFPLATLTLPSQAATQDAIGTFTTDVPVFTADDVMTRLLGTLSNVGTARIQTFVDSKTVTAKVETPWSVLTPIPTGSWRIAPVWDWEFRYAKPADYIRLVEVQDTSVRGVSGRILWSWWRDLSNVPEPVKVEGSYLVSNAGGRLNLSYTRDVTDLNLWDPLALKTYIQHLAYMTAYAVTGSLQATRTQHDAWKEVQAEARTANGQEGTLNDSGSDIFLVVRV